MESLVADLLAAYHAVPSEPPSWAYRLPSGTTLRATIPFVGREYGASAPRIAIFASAENLAHYERAPETVPAFLNDHRALNRHRAAFEEAGAAEPDAPWPKLHIGPIENGSLLCAAYFVRQRLGCLAAVPSPAAFVEQLLLANVGKYSKRGTVNRDYIHALADLRPSLPYLRADLREARPDVVLLPGSALRHRAVCSVLAEEVPAARVLPVPQFNATVVNVHLARFHDRARAAREPGGHAARGLDGELARLSRRPRLPIPGVAGRHASAVVADPRRRHEVRAVLDHARVMVKLLEESPR